jgi:hypothetical protein
VAEEERGTREDKIRDLIRWESTDAEAVAQQLLARVRMAQKAGITCGVVTCFVTADGDGKRAYEAACSKLPVEVVGWATEAIKRQTIRFLEVGE